MRNLPEISRSRPSQQRLHQLQSLMKVRDSGMPDAAFWESLFNVDLVLDRMAINGSVRDLAEFGCGYGTFTLPAAQRISGTLHTFDVDNEAMALARARAAASGLANIVFLHRDFIDAGTGLPDACVDYVMLFNILHHESPVEIIREAWRILRPGGLVGAIHWIHSAATPRGPALEIRPKPEALLELLRESGFQPVQAAPIELPPWHFGVLASKSLPE
ncbi:MAG: methyltransferase domain-containing protein [Elusimicrobia bacterium]|nr:methyltransferase domain-containing protein [Elusimicrobiota bacterium]